MRAIEFLEDFNPTMTPKSSDFSQKSFTQPADTNKPGDATPGPPNPRDQAINDIVSNFNKKMIDKPTAEKQLKTQGIPDTDLSKHLDQTNS